MPYARPVNRLLSRIDARTAARGLGWWGVGIGIAQILAPAAFNRLIGASGSISLTRLAGLRDIAVGAGLLSRPRPAPWLWLRVGGDVMDAARLGSSFVSPGANHARLLGAMAVNAAIATIDLHCAERYGRNVGSTGLMHIRATVDIRRTAAELYDFWRDFRNLPRVMRHLQAVEPLDRHRSHWVARAPTGTRVEWDAEIIDDAPHRRIAWRTLEHADVYHAGSVRFEALEHRDMTRVTVHLAYRPPAGLVGHTLARLLGDDPAQQVESDLRALKHALEGRPPQHERQQPPGRTHTTLHVTG